MSKNILLTLLFLAFSYISDAQSEKEVAPPYNIKTVSFVVNGQNSVSLFRLNDPFQLQFDDLYGDESNYYYQIVHCDYDWKKSQLSPAEYIQGFDDQRVQEYYNSFNTLQIYSHYKLNFPNKFTRFLVSGNYMLKIVNEAKEVVFSRKFVIYEDLVSVPIQVKKARSLKAIDGKQNLDFAIKSQAIQFQSPLLNVKISILKNSQFNTAINNVKPMYTIGNDLIYKYDAETQFWAGNEFLFFENKNIQAAANNVAFIDAKGIYNAHLYTNNARANNIYTYYPDINGNFVVKKINAENNELEADYAWVYFSLSAPAYFGKSDIYVTGMYNNFALTAENKMDYNKEKAIYEKAIMIKQGFTNYQYTITDDEGTVDEENNLDGNFWQTENNYSILVYYRENGQRYDRIIGKGIASSVDIIN